MRLGTASMKVSIGGKEFNVADQPADFWGWVQKGNYDPEWKFLRDNLRPEHTFLDLGAWVGSHSLYASTIANRVVAVEPDPVYLEVHSFWWTKPDETYDRLMKLGRMYGATIHGNALLIP